jgi:hypothetical protein
LTGTLYLLPLLAAAALALYVSVYSIYFRASRPFPLTPWESAFIVDAYRVTQNVPVYEPYETGHATHMYGPLGTYLLGSTFYFTGPNLYAGRLISLAAALALCALFLWAFIEQRKWVYYFIGLALFIPLHYRCRAYFTETRPDMLGLLFAGLSLFAAYRAHQAGRFAWYAASAVCVVLAFLSKQTYAIAVLVPPLAVLLTRPPRLWRHLLYSLVPGVALGVTLAILYVEFPLVWLYTISVPRRFRFFPEKLQLGVYGLVMYSPLFAVLLFVLAMQKTFEVRRETKILWILAAILVGSAAAVPAFGKHGGSYNSLMLAYAPMAAFTMVAFPRFWDLLSQPHVSPIMRVAVSIVVALLFVATTFAIPAAERVAFRLASNNENYAKAIEVARGLEGRVSCPDDPTVMLFAKGQMDRSLDAELDARGRPPRMPRAIERQLQSTDWFIRIHTDFSGLGKDGTSTMAYLGFRKVGSRGLGPGYSLWRRNPRPPAATALAATRPTTAPTPAPIPRAPALPRHTVP